MPDAPWWEGIEGFEGTPQDEPPLDLEAFKARVAELKQAQAENRRITIGIRELYERWMLEAQRSPDDGIGTGWPTIDRGLIRPVLPGEVVVLAARTGVGKTWAVQQICEHAAESPHHHIVISSLEMSFYQLGERFAAHAQGIPPDEALSRAMSGDLDIEDLMANTPGAERWQIDEQGITVSGLNNLVETAAEKFNAAPTILAVDYMGLLGGKGKLYERMSENARELKNIAKRHNIVVLAAVQLSRGGGGSGEDEPNLDAMRDSGAIEEACDRALLFWRVKDSEQVMVKIGKNRYGKTGFKTRLVYRSSMMLEEMSELELYSADLPY